MITFLGHVDHGKTSLLDRIIGIDVVSRESGGSPSISARIRWKRMAADFVRRYSRARSIHEMRPAGPT